MYHPLRRQVWAPLLAGLLLCTAAQAETGFLARDTILHQQASSASDSVTTLPAKTSISILARQGAWMSIQDGSGNKGWVRMFDVRTSSGQQGDSGLSQMASLFKTGSSGDAVSNGVKGLDDEDSLKNAKPNTAEAAKLGQFASNSGDAGSAAQHAQLSAHSVDWLPTGGK